MILIDSREQWKDQIQSKLQSLHVNAQILKLEHYTDYVLTSDNKDVQNVVAIQRKTIGEVLSQFKDIQTRLPELQEYGVPWLLVEENNLFINTNGMLMSKRGKLLYETGVKAQSYYNFLHSVQRGGTYVKTTLDWEQSVWWLYSLHSYIQKRHLPHRDKKFTKTEELIGALKAIPGVGLENAQLLNATYELLYKPLKILTPDMRSNTLEQNTLMRNAPDANPLMLKAFDKILTKVKSVLRGKKLSKNVLMNQLKSRITRDEALLNAFISVLIEEGYLQKEQKGKYVYYSINKKEEKR